MVGVVGVALTSLYLDMSAAEFLRLLVAAIVFYWGTDAVLATRFGLARVEPISAWLSGRRDEEATATAWRAAASLPIELLRLRRLYVAAAVAGLAWDSYTAWELNLPAYAVAILFPGSCLVYLYWVVLRFLGAEQVLRPVLKSIAAELPDQAPLPVIKFPLRRRLIAALPAIVVITGAAVPALTAGAGGELESLAIGVLVATTFAFVIAIPLIDLLSDSVVAPIAELEGASERVGRGDLKTRVPVFSTDETGGLARAFNRMVAGLAERERIRDAFGTYVDREVAEHILREGTNLAGEEVEVTMMFIDIRDFTGYAERADAAEVVGTVNRLWGCVVPLIHDHGGHVDKFVGDGLLAVFGAPRRQPDHADQALAAAQQIAEAVEHEFQGELEIGIGLNSGNVVAGNVGGGGRLEFSVIGDAVNVAARVEAATRQTGDVILIAERTKELLARSDVELAERPDVTLKGKREAVAVYAPGAAGERDVAGKAGRAADAG
jgi:adenylate cyclase